MNEIGLIKKMAFKVNPKQFAKITILKKKKKTLYTWNTVWIFPMAPQKVQLGLESL